MKKITLFRKPVEGKPLPPWHVGFNGREFGFERYDLALKEAIFLMHYIGTSAFFGDTADGDDAEIWRVESDGRETLLDATSDREITRMKVLKWWGEK